MGPVNHKAFIRRKRKGQKQKRRNDEAESKRGGLEVVMLLALEREEVMSQRMWATSGSQKRQEQIPPYSFQKEASQPLNHLDFRPLSLIFNFYH